MSATAGGTRFLLHCQPSFVEGFGEPVVHTLGVPAGSIKPGPMDDRIKVVDARNKSLYDDNTLPPYRGTDIEDAAEPGGDGHFDALDQASPQFRAAHAYASMRMVLDVWESYSGEKVRWFFADDYGRLEVIPYVDWPNGQAGYGFVELGYAKDDAGAKQPFALNFDVLAHEMGHIILASELGIPMEPDYTQYRGFQEAAADTISLLSVLHFEHFRKHLLDKTYGNLYAQNELNKLAETSKTKQIRSACHPYKMSDIPYAWTPSKYLSQKQLHKLAQPFTGAIFDILVEVFQEELVERGLITRDLDNRSVSDADDQVVLDAIERGFKEAYEKSPEGFMEALEHAMAFMGKRLVLSWKRLNVDELTLWNAAASFMTVDRRLSGNKYQNIIRECFRWREFEP